MSLEYKFETRCIHRNESEKYSYGAVTIPIYQTATFSHPGIAQSTGYDYSRVSNPTRTELEKTVNDLEGAYDTVACTTGMAAIGIFLELFEGGSHIICTQDLYGGSVRMFETLGKQRNIKFTYTDTSNIENVEKQITKDTKALFIETPSNPTMMVTDLKKIKELSDKYNLILAVDNTFLSPYFQNPIRLGADIVIHSGTKFLGGHNDTLAGFICVRNKELSEKVRFIYKTTGPCLAPFDSFLILRGIKTLAIRQQRQQSNAIQIAEWLKNHSKIEKVYYVGLPENPGYEVNKSQASGFGSMISFTTDTEKTAREILEKVKLISYAESLGGVESLITYPMLQTHADVPKDVREKLGINERFLRMSVGIEDISDLIADLEQALQ